MKRWRYVVLALALATGLLVWRAEPIMMAQLAGKLEETSLADRMALLEEAIDIRLPQSGEAPFPVVLQFHGCAGVRDEFQRQWADLANRAGYAAMIVDSMTPRGRSRRNALDTVCKGKALLGQERAGDVLAAMMIAKNDLRLDEDRVVLAGWSHGGWSVMDYLTMKTGETPPGIAPDAGRTPAPAGVIVFYPYCGRGALSRFKPWPETPPTLALIAGEDSIVDARQCISYFEKRRRSSAMIDLVVYPDAEHVFDDPFLEPAYIDWYNEEYFEDAKIRYETFLKTLAPRP